MNHAFLIVAHDSPELLQRIVKRLEAPNHYIFIHLDKKSKSRRVDVLRGGYLSENKRYKVSWGGYSMIKAEINLLLEANSFSERIDYFHLISGHDYPCVSNAEFDRFFEIEGKERSFMHFDSDEQHELWKVKISNRINKWHLNDYYINGKVRRIIECIFNTTMPRSYNRELYAGWNWFSFHNSLVKWILKYINDNPDFLKRFKFTTCGDEVFFHTLLYPYIKELNIEKDNSLRYIDWYPSRSASTLPLVLDERDYQSIIKSGAFFCRKVFLDKSGELLDLLDNRSNG